MAGIGNIYADEALFASGIHPLEQGGLLSPNEGRRLHRAVVVRLTEAIQQLAPLIGNGGPATESREGLERLLVPRSEGVPCSACDTPISRVIVRGRNSYFCGRCQAESERRTPVLRQTIPATDRSFQPSVTSHYHFGRWAQVGV